MASIFDTTISGWQSPVTYPKYGIASGDANRYFYSLTDNNQGNNPISNLGTLWDGYTLINSTYIPDFFWKPSYATVSQSNPRIIRIKFGNGYEKRIPDGFNTNLITMQVAFENRKESEAVSILHFFQQMNGQTAFIYNMPTVYSKSISSINTRFLCPNWETTYNFYQNYTIRATFEEVSA